MVKTTTIELISKKEFELIRITKDILKAVEESGIQNGVVFAITARIHQHQGAGSLEHKTGIINLGNRSISRSEHRNDLCFQCCFLSFHKTLHIYHITSTYLGAMPNMRKHFAKNLSGFSCLIKRLQSALVFTAPAGLQV